eukprot:269373_1
MAEDEYDDDEDFEYEYEDGSFEDGEDVNLDEADPDFNDADFGADDDGFDDDGAGWDDDGDIDVQEQQYIPIQKPDEDSDEFELDQHGNVLSPRDMKRQPSVDLQCWACSNCKATNKLSWTLTKFQMKCCMCKQDTYAPTVKIFDSMQWDEPSNDFWECKRCTLHNAIGSNECEACQGPNEEYKQQSDDEDYGAGQFTKDEESEDDTQHPPHHHGAHEHPHHHMHGMGHGGGMHDMFGSMMGGIGGMGMGGIRRGGHMRGMGRGRGAPMNPPRPRKLPKNTKPIDKRKERNLRNLLIVGFIRHCNAPHLPTKFFDFFQSILYVF